MLCFGWQEAVRPGQIFPSVTAPIKVYLTAEDITNIQCSNSTYFPGSRMAEHQISFEALGEKHSGTYTVQQGDDGESFTFHTDGKDLWETINLELEDLTTVRSLLRYCNNLNQYWSVLPAA